MDKIVLGTVQLGLDYGINNSMGKPKHEDAFDILETAYESGIRILDTAPVYGDSESVIGEYIKKSKNNFAVCSKHPAVKNRDNIKEQVDINISSSMERLGLGKIDFYFVHNFEDVINYPDLIQVLIDKKQEGLIDNIGISIYDTEELDYIANNLIGKIDIIQIPFNIFDLRWIKSDLLNKIRHFNIRVFARSIFLQGLIFASKEKADLISPYAYNHIRKLSEYCNENGMSVIEAALQFVLRQPDIDYVLVGCESSNQLRETIKYATSSEAIDIVQLNEFASKNFYNVDKQIIDPRKWRLKK